jgi:hypothetical protein
MLRPMRACDSKRMLARSWKMRWVLPRRLALCLLLASATLAAAAEADGNVDQRRQEVERLEQELLKAKQELQRVEQENRELRKLAPTNALPVPRIESLPPLAEGQVLEAAVISAHFETDREAATRRYADHVLRVEGRIEDFDRPLLERTYELRLAGAAFSPPVVARFNYLDRYRTVFTRDDGATLVGRIDDRATRVLHRKGDKIVVQGRCKGFKDGAIVLSSCTRVP